MVKLSPFTRRMLDIQGYENVCDEDFGDIARWMKMAIFGCATLVAIALAIGPIPMLWVMVTIAAVAGISPVHPLDLIYNYGIRYITGTGKLLRRSGLNRAACALATVWLLGTIAAVNAGMMVLFQLLGWSMVGVAYLVGTMDVCMPSYFFRLFIGYPPKREKV